MDIWNLIAERKIQEAAEEGAFDNLDGAGVPLPPEEDALIDPAARLGVRLLRNNGFLPGWMQERKDMEASIQALLSAKAMDPERRRQRIRGLNRRIRDFNLTAPSARFHLIPLDPES